MVSSGVNVSARALDWWDWRPYFRVFKSDESLKSILSIKNLDLQWWKCNIWETIKRIVLASSTPSNLFQENLGTSCSEWKCACGQNAPAWCLSSSPNIVEGGQWTLNQTWFCSKLCDVQTIYFMFSSDMKGDCAWYDILSLSDIIKNNFSVSRSCVIPWFETF